MALLWMPPLFSEEDIVELCMKQGHTHPLGVLHYLAMESVILFSTAEDLRCASHELVDMMELRDIAIMVANFGSYGGPYHLI